MSSTLITFQDKYFKYKGQCRDPDNQGLAISRYESTFLVDLVASYVLEKCSNEFKNTLYHGIYRDDGLIVFNSKLTQHQISSWLTKFQKQANHHAGGTFLQFTMSICENERKNIRKEDEGKVKISDKISMIKSNHFPYLHIEL